VDITITTIAERPELTDALWTMAQAWPEFMLHDPVGWGYFGRLPATFGEFTLVATDDNGEIAARAHSLPFALDAPGRGTLPPTGWDQVLMWGFADHASGAKPDTASALDITIRADLQGKGLSAVLLGAMRANAKAQGLQELVAPVRPSAKHREPHTPMAEYAHRTRDDGLPADPWLRTHVRAGAVIDTVAPASMVVPGSLAQWRGWTGLPFDTDGWVEVPGALVPVRCVPAHDYAVYVEPNVWVRHQL
jgi:GNAT superfamily N-acetyltransferase